MASIKKLGITAIRSYNPDEETVIEFFKPLTLILGRNGGGKTTLIECLKMIVCGSFPPNTQSGKTWITDPKLVNRPEVKAKIQLVFKAINGKDVLAIRTFQLTHTEKKMEFRQVEQVLKTKDANGKTVSITHTCAEMDRQIPELLGVSQAVLENVIFCHQEESLWPFGDTSTLKKIFDELFDTTMYTSLLEHLRKIQKEHKKQHKEYNAKFELEKKDFDLYNKKKKLLIKNIEEITYLQNDLGEYEKRINSIKDKLKIDNDTKPHIVQEIHLLEFRIEDNKRQQQVYQQQPNMYTNVSIEEIEKVKNDKNMQYKLKEEELTHWQTKQADLIKRQGLLEQNRNEITSAEKDTSETMTRIKDCRMKIQTILQNSGYKGNDLEHKPNRDIIHIVEEYIEKIEQNYKRKRDELQKNEDKLNENSTNNSAELKIKMNEIKKFDIEFIGLNQKIGNLEKEINQLQKILNKLGNDNNNNNNNNEDKVNYVERIDDLKEQYNNNIQSIRDKLKESKEISNKRADAQKVKELHNKRGEYNEMIKGLEQMKMDLQNHRDESKMLFQNLNEISEVKLNVQEATDSMMACIESYSKKLASERNTVQNKREKINDSIKECEAFIQFKSSELTKKQNSIKEFMTKLEQNKIKSIIEKEGDFNSKYQEIKGECKESEKRLLAMQYTEDIFKECYNKSCEKKKCTLCSKKLDDSDKKRIEQKSEEMVAKSALKAQAEMENFEDLKTKKTLLKDLKNEYEEYTKNRDIVRTYEREITSKEKDKGNFIQQLNNLKTTLDNYTNIFNLVDQIKSIAIKMDKLKIDIKAKSDQIDYMERQNPSLKKSDPLQSSSPRIIDDKYFKDLLDKLENEYNRLEKENKDLQNEIDKLENQRRMMDIMQKTQEEDKKKLNGKLEELEISKKRKQEIERILPQHKVDIEELNKVIRRVEEDRAEIKASIKKLDEENGGKRIQLDALAKDLKRYDDLWILASSINSKKKENDTLIKNIDAELDELSKELIETRAHISNLTEYIDKKPETMKGLDNAIQLKKLQKAQQDLMKDLRKQKDELMIINEHERQNKVLSDQRQAEMDKMNQTKGKYTMKTSEYESSLKEIKAHVYLTEKMYLENFFHKEMHQYVADDLDIYISNLEKALMIFHKQKMEEINKIISDLWIKTYKGGDIKKIEIKSDVEPNSKNKSYNYRIVFFNPDGKELDMKGRCSMGQKVIASIVVRLALAEAFCTNCGILTLDEPTTNLDKDHIKKLAKELSNLIKSRQNNSNFQLVVITHDKEFIQELSDNSEYYYKVYKDHTGFSKIELAETRTLL